MKHTILENIIGEKEFTRCLELAIELTTERDAVERGLSYTQLLENNLFDLAFQSYKRKYDKDNGYVDDVRRSGLWYTKFAFYLKYEKNKNYIKNKIR